MAGKLDNSQTIAQSFVATKPHLSSIVLSGTILENSERYPTESLKLRGSNADAGNIATKIVRLPCLSGNFELDFTFNPQADSAIPETEWFILDCSTHRDRCRVDNDIALCHCTDADPIGAIYCAVKNFRPPNTPYISLNYADSH